MTLTEETPVLDNKQLYELIKSVEQRVEALEKVKRRNKRK
jgi:hypothetical protein